MIGTALSLGDFVFAADNTDTNPATEPGVPIYLLNDTLLVADNADLWDGSIGVPLNIDEHGDDVLVTDVWTGTLSDGVTFYCGILACSFLGEDAPAIGSSAETGSSSDLAKIGDWVAYSPGYPDTELPFYAISGKLTVIPEPGTLMLLGLGVAGLGAAGRRRSLH